MRWPRASPTRISACTASSPRASRCSSSPSASRRPALVRKADAPAAARCRRRTRRRAIVGRRESGCRRRGGFVDLPGLRPRRAAARATASPGPRSSSRWTRPPLVLPGMTARVDAYLNLILEAVMSACRPAVMHLAAGHRPDHRRGDRRALSSIVEETGEALIRASLFHQHQGAARLLDGAVRRRTARRCARPSTSRSISAASSASSRISCSATRSRTCGRATSSSATTPTRAAARTCPTSCWPSRSSSTAASSPGRSTSRTMPTSPIAAMPTSTRRACASRRCGSTAPASCRRTCSDLILLNCQVPRERLSDLRAQMAANRLGVQRFQALCGEVRPRDGAGGRRGAAGLRRAQDARRHRRHARRHLSLRGRVRQPRRSTSDLPLVGRGHGQGR